MYRPEGFKNPYSNYKVVQTHANPEYYEDIFEAGADAMLKALINQYDTTVEEFGYFIFVPKEVKHD